MARTPGRSPTTRATRGRTTTGTAGVSRLPRLRISLLLTLYYAAVVLSVGWAGRPPGLRPGAVAPYDIRARKSFSYPDQESTADRVVAARRAVPGCYLRKERWGEQVLAVTERLFAVVEAAESEKDLEDRLQALGVEVDAAPLLTLKRDRGTETLKHMLERIRAAVNYLGKGLILSDRQYSEEINSGHEVVTEILLPSGQGSALRLSKEAVSLEDARRLLGERFDEVLAEFPPTAVVVVRGRLVRDLFPNASFSIEHTEAARGKAADGVRPVSTQVAKGDLIVRKGEVVNDAIYRKMVEEERAILSSRSLLSRLGRWLGMVGLVGVVFVPCALLVRMFEGAGQFLRRRFVSLAVGVLLVILASRVLASYLFVSSMSPVLLLGIAGGMVFSLGAAFTVVVGTVLLVTVATGENVGFALAMTAGALAGVMWIGQVSRRSGVLTTGALAGCVVFAGLIGWDLATDPEDLLSALKGAAYGLLNGLLSGAILAGLMPLVEQVFSATTRISLLELSDQEHPALRDLLMRAPGTYHHSLVLGNMAETCARVVGADALLTRVSSYYHDIGKMTKPEYFVENQPPGRSPHETLSPSMSALVIVSHVKDGVDLAKEYRLPTVIQDVIEQHHGTTLVEFFYRRALEEEEADKSRVSQRLFRYPGPLPQTKEAAIVMLADSVEAASRSLEEPSPAHIENLVSGIVQRRLLDGQLDDSDLTFRDLKQIRETMVRALGSMYHSRPRYPGQQGASSGS